MKNTPTPTKRLMTNEIICCRTFFKYRKLSPLQRLDVHELYLQEVLGADSKGEDNSKAGTETDSELRVKDEVLYDGVHVMMHRILAMGCEP